MIRSLALMQYCRIDKPGKYTISVSHDLGWVAGYNFWGKTNNKDLPTATTTVTFIAPTAAQAQNIIGNMFKPPAEPHLHAGQFANQQAGFTVLGNPIYLQILLNTVHAGDSPQARNAIHGINSIATPEATQALIKLASDNNPAIAKSAFAALVMRIPDPEWSGELPRRSAFGDTASDERKQLAQHSWKPEFAPQLLAIARPLLLSTDKLQCERAAFIIESIGSKEDIKYMAPALDQALEKSKTLPFEKYVYPRPRGSLSELMRTTQILVKRSSSAPNIQNLLAKWRYF